MNDNKFAGVLFFCLLPKKFFYVDKNRRFNNLRNEWRKAIIKAEVNKWYRIHDLRHTFAHNMLPYTNERAVQLQLGHKDPRSTRIYTTFSAQDKIAYLDKAEMPFFGTNSDTKD